MKFVAYSNILVRAAVADDAAQTRAAETFLASCEAVIVTMSSLCKLVWVLRSGYRISRGDTASFVRSIADAFNIVTDRAAIAMGIEFMNSGADFADGLIAYEGKSMGAEVFASFHLRALAAAKHLGVATHHPQHG